ncbi:MAG TPA: L,D-transpeptidase, partial [Symbiobacteriaceae bacterium]|nr:L,D-transpeptidase [Symbiobacteriaceae bacterium]
MQLPASRRPSHQRPSPAVFWRRRLLVLLLFVGLGALCWGAIRLVDANLRQIEPSPGFKVERHLPVRDGLRIAVGAPSAAGYRPLALIQGSGSAAKTVGANVAVKSDLPLSVRQDLGAIPVLWAEQTQVRQGAPREVTIPGGKALEARGGEPIPQAWLIMAEGLREVPKPVSLLAPKPPPHPTGIVIDLDWNALWYFEDGQLLLTASVSSGQFRQGPAISPTNWQQNHLTPRGEFKVALLQEGMAIPSENLPAGHPLNPYGSRWIGFSVLPGDKASIWGIHGTINPEGIG